MDWHYIIGATQHGPVSENELSRLAANGIITNDSLVWNESMADWQPLRSAALATAAPASGSQATATCVECGQTFPAQHLVSVSGAQVCPDCKDLALDKLRQEVRLREGVRIVSGLAWRDGKKLVIADKAALPDVCVKCGESAGASRMRRKFYSHSGWLWLVLVGWIGVIVYFMLRKKVEGDIAVCYNCKRSRLKHLLIAWSLLLGGIGVGVAGSAAEAAWGFAGLGMFLVSLFWFILKTQLLRATKVKDGHAWLTGVHERCLQTLPPWDDNG
jgi:hypothetical protein